MNPTVSVIIAAYNYGHYLPQALDSALAQSFTDLEILVVDDGSTDDTAEVIERYAHDPRMRYVRREHAGQPATKNAGIRASRGRWIAFLDADDAWLTDKLARQLAAAGDDPRTGVVYCDFAPIDAEGHLLATATRTLPRGEVLDEMFLRNFVCFSSAMVRREVFDRIGMFDESIPLAIDYDLWLRAAREFSFESVAAPLVRYRTGHANLSKRAEERVLIALGIMDRYVRRRENHAAAFPTLECPAIVSQTIVRRAYCETWCTLGLLRREHSALAAMAAYSRALCYQPTRWAAWRGLFSAMVPELGRRWLRWINGSPLDWRVPQRLGSTTA